MKRLIVDIDDTISFTIDRDWKNAKPNIPLINKLNELYDNGIEIIYQTARGCLSFNGDRKAAEKYYRPIIEEWFKKHNVKYTELSFQKRLADFYIDDKAIRPDEFLELNVEKLQGGLSGAEIEKRGNKVYKTHSNSLQAANWYQKAKSIVNVPKIYSVIGDTICMEYIESNCDLKVEKIDEILQEFKKIPSYVDFNVYIKRIENHLELYNPKYKNFVLEKLKSIECFMNKNKSFCHGDFSIDNMICRDEKIYLIDPNYDENSYSSWLLDLSKLLMSTKRFNEDLIYKFFKEKYKNISNTLNILELSHWIRMRKYTKDKKFVDDNIKKVMERLEWKK